MFFNCFDIYKVSIGSFYFWKNSRLLKKNG
jgi:hypothetical protein